MMPIKILLLWIMGFSGGIGVAGGVFAFISILGIIPRLCARLRLGPYAYPLEECIFLGGVAGCLLTMFSTPIPLGYLGLTIFGLFAGIFVGCLAMALAETLKVIPVLAQRTKLHVGLPVLMIAIGIGKALGSFYQLYWCWPGNK